MIDGEISKQRAFSRRQLLTAALGVAGSAVILGGTAARPRPARALLRAEGVHHLVWVWQFSTDASPEIIGADLVQHNLGIVLKTHDGVEWMSKYDDSKYAVSGPSQVATLAQYYEDAGVPFHAWSVVKGIDPIKEARMAAEVLAAGARSIHLDVEPHGGFWVGTSQDAATFANELRRLQPEANVVTSLDPRPWILEQVPLDEFAGISNELSPQLYWLTYNSQANYERYHEAGYAVGLNGVTPEFLVESTFDYLKGYGLPLTPVGQGATANLNEWRSFIDHSFLRGANSVSVWRYGVSPPELWSLLVEKPPIQPPAPVALTEEVHTVQPGDTVGSIAAMYGVSVDDIVALNQIADANLISVGQQVRIPLGGVTMSQGVGAPAPAPVPAASGRVHTVAAGDTLSAIAGQYGVSVDGIVALNGLTDPHYITVGQTLSLP